MENPFQIINEKLDNIEKILSQIKTGQVTEKPFVVKQLKELMNVKEVAEYLSISKSKIYKYTCYRQIPFIKTGKKIYFRKAEVDEWLNTYRKKTTAEMEAEVTMTWKPRKSRNK